MMIIKYGIKYHADIKELSYLNSVSPKNATQNFQIYGPQRNWIVYLFATQSFVKILVMMVVIYMFSQNALIIFVQNTLSRSVQWLRSNLPEPYVAILQLEYLAIDFVN